MKKAYFGLFILLLPILVSCNKQKNFLALGNFNDETINSLKTLLKMDGNNYFISENMQSGELFKIVDSNASYYENGKKHPFYVEASKAKLILINVGLYDVIPSMEIKEDENVLNYDDNLLNKQLEVFSYHMYHIIEEVRSINNKADIFVLSAYNIFNFEKPEEKLFNNIVKEVNDSINDSVKDFDNIKYISLVDMKNQLKEDASLTPNLLLANIIRSHYNE